MLGNPRWLLSCKLDVETPILVGKFKARSLTKRRGLPARQDAAVTCISQQPACYATSPEYAMKKILFAAVCSLLFFVTGAAQAKDLDCAVQPLPPRVKSLLDKIQTGRYVIADKEWYTWGGAVIRSSDGKFHMFYARWPKRLHFTAWLAHSQIMHVVAERPEGPYRARAVAIPDHGPDRGEWFTAHNPKIKKFGGKYYLYFIQTRGEPDVSQREKISLIGYRHPKWKKLRENQRTFVAVSSSLDGPWHISKQPIVEPAKTIATLTVNPAVCRGPDGTYFMIVKGDKPGEKRFIRNEALATAPAPEGPWTIYDKPVIDYLDTEDCSIWYGKLQQRFFAVFHARSFIGLITSDDGYSWRKAKPFKLTPKQIALADGSVWKPQRMERPFVLTDSAGNPQILFVACRKGNASFNIALPLKCQHE